MIETCHRRLHAVVFFAVVLLNLPLAWCEALARPSSAPSLAMSTASSDMVSERFAAMLRLVPLWLQISPVVSVSGRAFEYYEANDMHRHKAKETLRREAISLVVSVMACVGALVLQPHVSHLGIISLDWRLILLLACWITLILIGPCWTVTALFFPSQPGAAYDDNLFFERRSRALLREWWWQHGQLWSLRPEVLMSWRCMAFG